ncbi:MAG: methyl-accepting chemotaxis protein, partial [Gammaproteobacteria bacterium]|nr:methyl-accepting chemotaxis protein [Gammaproteobacteria bacterium]
MRLKSLTNLNTLLLVTVCVALAVTLWWSQRALERPYLLMARYLSLSQQFQGEAAQNISTYLESGDTLRHSAALQSLASLEQAITELPAQLADDLRPSLTELTAFSTNEL